MAENSYKEWTLIMDRIALPGSWNMAVDEFLFQSLQKEPQTCLRFYSWARPTASLGYSQKIHKVLNVKFCKSHGIDIVRRITGGKLVLHDKEVTYSLCSSDIDLFTSTLSRSYRLISEALMRGLEKMGLRPTLAARPPLAYTRGDLPCFSFPSQNEIEVNGKKIIGSAQKRIGTKFIQHGSIPLEEDERLLRCVSSLKEDGEVRMTSLFQELGKKMSFERAAQLFSEGISEYFAVTLKMKEFSEDELMAIRKLQKDRYSNPAWTYLRE